MISDNVPDTPHERAKVLAVAATRAIRAHLRAHPLASARVERELTIFFELTMRGWERPLWWERHR